MKFLSLLCMLTGLSSFTGNLYSQNFDLIGTGVNPNTNWNILKIADSKFPARAFGKPTQINGFTSVDKNNVKQAAIAFLKQEQATFGIDPNTLEFKSERGFNKLYYVTFTQVYKGLEVLQTEVELRITNSGKVMAYGIKYYDNINLDVKPTLSSSVCVKAAIKDIKCAKATDEIQSGSKMYVIAIQNSGVTKYKLVYNYLFKADDNFTEYFAFVDANTGELIERKSLVQDATTKIKFIGSVNKLNATDPLSVEAMPYLNVTADSTVYQADSTGTISMDLNKQVKINGPINGKYCKVMSYQKEVGSINATIDSGIDSTLLLDSQLSLQERNAYYYLHLGRNTLLSIDPEISPKISDNKIPIIFEYKQGTANASWGFGMIQFYALNDTNNLMLNMPDVLLHEYGHAINEFMYRHIALDSRGMLNTACNEALADIFATYVCNTNIIAKGCDASKPDIGFRNLKNTNIYPDSINNEVHHNGLILSGAFWDLKELTSLDYLKKISHFAKYGIPDDEKDEIAFAEWFTEVLIADDNMGDGDQDLSNGSPNFDKILTAFNNHKIGVDVFQNNIFSYKGISDIGNSLKNFTIDYSFDILNSKLLNVDSSFVIYSTDNFETSNKCRGERIKGNDYQATATTIIPNGSYVKYYFEYYVNGSDSVFKQYKRNEKKTAFSALVGYTKMISDDFETNSGWTFRDLDDCATIGLWEINVPEFDTTLSHKSEPWEDHSIKGTKCLVTDPIYDMNYFWTHVNSHWTNGRTSVTSPRYNTLNYNNPIVVFYKWLSLGFSEPRDFKEVPLEVYCSYDDGVNWDLTASYDDFNMKWTENIIPIKPSDAFRIKFVIDAPDVTNKSLSYLSKSYIDDFSILSVGDAPLSVDEAKSDLELKAFPNPAHTSVRFYAPHSNNVQIYNSLGELVKELEIQNGSAEWDRISNNNAKVPNGMYFCKTIANGKSVMKSVIIAD